MMTKVLGVLDVKTTGRPGNASISPAHVVDGRRSILSKKSDVTLSHILGAKEFFSTFPSENFTHLRTPKPRAGHSQLSYNADDTPQKKALPQHKSQEKEASGIVGGENAADAEVKPAAPAAKEDTPLSTSTEAQTTEDEVESQRISDTEVPVPITEATKSNEAALAETTDVHQTEVDEQAQHVEKKTQVESTKESDQPSKMPAGDAEADKQSSHPQEATTESAAAEAEAVTEAPPTPLEQPTEGEKATMVTEMLDDGLATPESRNETEEAVQAEGEAEAVATVDTEVEETKEGKTNETEEEKASAVPEAEEEKEDKDKPAVDSDTTEEVSKKKKKTSEPEKAKKKEAADKSADAKAGEREKTSDTLETYSQFTQRVNAEKKNDSKLMALRNLDFQN